MQIEEFVRWSDAQGFICPVIRDEKIYRFREKDSRNYARTGKKIHQFITPSGRIINVVCKKDGTICRLSK